MAQIEDESSIILYCYIMFLYNKWFLKNHTNNYFLKGINPLSMIINLLVSSINIIV
jgi:hypothetical protein